MVSHLIFGAVLGALFSQTTTFSMRPEDKKDLWSQLMS